MSPTGKCVAAELGPGSADDARSPPESIPFGRELMAKATSLGGGSHGLLCLSRSHEMLRWAIPNQVSIQAKTSADENPFRYYHSRAIASEKFKLDKDAALRESVIVYCVYEILLRLRVLNNAGLAPACRAKARGACSNNRNRFFLQLCRLLPQAGEHINVKQEVVLCAAVVFSGKLPRAFVLACTVSFRSAAGGDREGNPGLS